MWTRGIDPIPAEPIRYRKTAAAISIHTLAGAAWLCWVPCGLAQPPGGGAQPAIGPATQSPKQYRIDARRPEKVGQELRIVATGSEEMVTTTMPTEPAERESSTFEVSGVRKVLETDQHRQATKIAFTVENCLEIKGNKKAEAAPRGAVVIVSAVDGKQDIRCEGPEVAISDRGTALLNKALEILTIKGRTLGK